MAVQPTPQLFCRVDGVEWVDYRFAPCLVGALSAGIIVYWVVALLFIVNAWLQSSIMRLRYSLGDLAFFLLHLATIT